MKCNHKNFTIHDATKNMQKSFQHVQKCFCQSKWLRALFDLCPKITQHFGKKNSWKKKICCPHFPGFFYTNGLDIGRNWNVKSKYSARLISTCKTINIVVKKLNFVNLTNFSSKSIFDHACGSKFTIYCCCSSYFLKSGAM